MRKSIPLTVGKLMDELCRLSDKALVTIKCSAQEFSFQKLRKRSDDVVEIEVAPCAESPSVVPSAEPELVNGR